MKDWTTEGMSSEYVERINKEKISTIMKRKDTIESKIRNHFRKESK